MMFRLLVLLVFLCLWSISSGHGYFSKTNADPLIRCYHRFYTNKYLNAMNYGYCWDPMNMNRTYDRARDWCVNSDGDSRLLAVNTVEKAKKITKFIADAAPYKKKIRSSLESESMSHLFWLSSITDGYWDSTKEKVVTAAEDPPGEDLQGKKCVVFNSHKSTWHLTSCTSPKNEYAILCEEVRNDYPDESYSADKASSDKTVVEQSCPEGYYLLYDKFCFFMSRNKIISPEAEKFCARHGGFVAWFSDDEKWSAVTRFVEDSTLRVSFDSAWLSGIERNGSSFKWKSSGTDARYLLNKLYTRVEHSEFEGKPPPSFYMDDTGEMGHCKHDCVSRNALCESKPEPKPTKSSPNDYEYTEFNGDNYDYDYKDGKPDEDVTFDANNILTKGP